MERGLSPDYFGIPVLSHSEATTLKLTLDLDMDRGQNTVVAWGDAALQRCLPIQQLIEHDVQQYAQYEADHVLSADEIEDFVEGVEEGYRFFVGCVAWARLERSPYRDIHTALAHNAELGIVPDISPATVRYLKNIRRGSASHVDDLAELALDSSKELAQICAGDYCFLSVRFEETLSMYTQLRGTHVDPDCCPTASGILHGTANAIQMYVAAYQQRVFDESMSSA